MDSYLRDFYSLFRPTLENLTRWVDILLVAYLNYRLFLLVRGTRAWQIAVGVFAFIGLLVLSKVLKLDTLHWILDKAALLGPVALVILFLPELRQGLEGLGKFGLGFQKLVANEHSTEAKTIDELVRAVSSMADERIGALIVVERTGSLDEIIANGVEVDAKVSGPLLQAIFYEGNPLHDGAVVLRGDTIVAAACRLPLSESSRLDQNVHMRHRAAVGVTEILDCLAIVVSEERGSISIAWEGRLRRLSNPVELRDLLNRELRGERVDPPPKPRRQRAKVDEAQAPEVQS